MQVADIEWGLIKAMNVVSGCARIGMLIKSIRILSFDFWQSRVIYIKRHGLLLPENEGAQIIQSTDMVLVLVRNEHRIKFGNVLAQHLLSEVGTGIHGHRHRAGLNQNGGAKALVARVLGLAHGTGATDDRNALRGSRT